MKLNLAQTGSKLEKLCPPKLSAELMITQKSLTQSYLLAPCAIPTNQQNYALLSPCSPPFYVNLWSVTISPDRIRMAIIVAVTSGHYSCPAQIFQRDVFSSASDD
ncbi:hypothetical protein RRG08_033159 [Elysia crispata]|uniref:Uncharacterized protein n=1 Tax=Elysia crispata TaxID=231223 RepID=A0AAE0YX42_9GAST|nr:hypothetical protein RRG08_033159 [Elysia crispata]